MATRRPTAWARPTSSPATRTCCAGTASPRPTASGSPHYDKNQTPVAATAWTDGSRPGSTRPPTAISATWSGRPTARWLAYVRAHGDVRPDLAVRASPRDDRTAVTSDRFDSYSPAFTPDGKWLYFLSDRTFQSLVGAPWGPRAAGAVLRPPDEDLLAGAGAGPALAVPAGERAGDARRRRRRARKTATKDGGGSDASRISTVDPAAPDASCPLPGRQLRGARGERQPPVLAEPARRRSRRPAALQALDIGKADLTPKTLVDDVSGYELSRDGKKLLVRKEQRAVRDRRGERRPASLDKAQVDLAGWSFPLDPREEWRQMFDEAWRLERDYFYDPHMHGVDWPAMQGEVPPAGGSRHRSRRAVGPAGADGQRAVGAAHLRLRRRHARRAGPGRSPPRWARTSPATPPPAAGGSTHVYRADPD